VGEDRTRDRPGDSLDRITTTEAARRLGITEGAVRKRAQRGKIPHERDEDGRLWVWLSPRETSRDSSRDKPGPSRDTSRDDSAAMLLVSELRDRVDFLQRELERKDAILLNMTQAIRAISPPTPEAETTQEAPGRPETPSEPVSRDETPPGPETDAKRLESLRRVAEGAGGGVVRDIAVWAGGLPFAGFTYLVNRVDLSIVGGGALAFYMLVDAIRDIIVMRREVGVVSRWNYVQAVSAVFVLVGTIYLVISGGIFIPTY
jgi:excisionase family DNA binding protein